MTFIEGIGNPNNQCEQKTPYPTKKPPRCLNLKDIWGEHSIQAKNPVILPLEGVKNRFSKVIIYPPCSDHHLKISNGLSLEQKVYRTKIWVKTRSEEEV